MSRREYAAHRGCALSTVQAAVDAHAIPVSRPGPRGRILVDEADALWAPGQRRDEAVLPVLSSAPRGGRSPLTGGGHQASGAVALLLNEVAELQRRLLAAKAEQREWQAKAARLEYEIRRGDLLPRFDVRADAHDTAARVVAALDSMGARLGGALSCTCRDPGQVQRLVDDEVRRTREALTASLFTREDEAPDAGA